MFLFVLKMFQPSYTKFILVLQKNFSYLGYDSPINGEYENITFKD